MTQIAVSVEARVLVEAVGLAKQASDKFRHFGNEPSYRHYLWLARELAQPLADAGLAQQLCAELSVTSFPAGVAK